MFEGTQNLPESPRRNILRDDLDDFLAEPVTPDEVRTKDDFIARIQPWLSQAMMVAGYPLKEMDDRLKLVFEKKDFFNRDAETIANDVNRIINNWAIDARTFAKAYDAEVSLKSSPFVPKEQSVQAADDVVPQTSTVKTIQPIVPIIPTIPAAAAASKLEEQSEAYRSQPATEFDEREAEYVESAKPKIEPARLTPQFSAPASASTIETNQPVAEIKPLEPLVLTDKLPDPLVLTKEQILPEPLVLTPEMRETESNEPIVLETVETVEEAVPENVDLTSAYQTKLDALNAQPFDHGAYVEYVFDLHTGLRHQYDEVITAARNNLKRFDGFYAPSPIEKQALQLLSSLQGQYAKMQKADSDYGLIRGALTEKLSSNPSEDIEADIKDLSQTYLDASKKLFANISKLESLIEEVKTEEKPSVAEVYRAQFEKMRVEGNQVLRSLPASHPLYQRLKSAIEGDSNNKGDLIKLIEAAAIDKAVLENSSNFIARRDQIKELIAFVKKEQEYQDFFERARGRVQKLESQFETIPASEKGAQVKTILAENIVKIKQALSETPSQIATVGVLENLHQQKSVIEMLLRDSEESITSVPQDETILVEPTGPVILSDDELIALIEKTPLAQNMAGAQERYQMRQGEIEKYLAFQRAQQSNERFSGPVYEKAKRLAGMLHLGKIGKAAAVLLALAGPAGLSNQKSDNLVLAGDLVPGSVFSQPNIDYRAIAEYLQTADGAIVVAEASAPIVPIVEAAAPEMPLTPTPVETIPGVILPDTVPGPERNNNATPLEIYSDDADSVPSDPGIVFNPEPVESVKLGKYLINYGDIFWDINEGQTLAGKLPVMSQINPYFKQALIDRVRDKINTNSKERDSIGGFGKDTSRPFADQLVTGEYMDLDALNKLAMDTAADYGYLQ